MLRKLTRFPLQLFLGLCLTAAVGAAVAPTDSQSTFEKAVQLQEDGNYREAIETFRDLTLESDDIASEVVGKCVPRALQCYQNLNEVRRVDEFLEATVEKHSQSWQVLSEAAYGYLWSQHHGYMIAGEFQRGNHRGGGKIVNAQRRDRARALQLLFDAVQLAAPSEETRRSAVSAGLLDRLSSALLSHSGVQTAWPLQLLTNLEELPDYEEGWGYYNRGGGAPVEEDGSPILFEEPQSWELAKNDGERWRWALAERTRWQPDLENRELFERAAFLQSQFGVETLASYGWYSYSDPKDNDAMKAKYALHTLGDQETLARLATSIQRFDLPAEHNHILLLQRIAEQQEDRSSWRTATERLAGVYENRRQYSKAASLWQSILAQDDGNRAHAMSRLEQIVGNWGRFEPTLSQPAGRGATIDFRFRNGNRVEFTAQRIKVPQLLADMKQYIKQWGASEQWRGEQIGNLGYRLVTEGDEKYLGDQVAQWSLDLQPRDNHFDRLQTVTTPLQQAGAYLVTAQMEGGNRHRVIVWLHDTAIVKKPLEQESLYFVADAVTGRPVAKCNVEFFGYRIEQRDDGQRRVETKNFAQFTNKNGIVRLPADEKNRRLRWLATATTDDGRFAYLGYSNVWLGRYREDQYRQVKSLAITDRPVYRPGHEVKFKFWVRNAQYDMRDESRFANQTFQVEIRDPRNERVYSESIVADAYGGLAGAWTLPEGATLGQYQLLVVNHGGGSFRVEEYKKPEFEVTVEAPEKPVALGESFTAKIKANYYFGSPVVNATVKYKVQRTSTVQPWYPPSPWDWLYDRGYGWLGQEYRWYPGWAKWGCIRPAPWWVWQAPQPPELVAEREVPIGPDGEVAVKIDTALAKLMHADQDHRYEIQAEVVDQSRRTIVGTGSVLAARRPFGVFVWMNRGYYRSGDSMRVNLAARAADGDPVQGEGTLRLLRIGYEDDQPVETELASWTLPTNARGDADLQITAAEPGQYRLSYVVTDSTGRQIEGGQVVTIRGDGFDGSDFRFNDLELVLDKREYQPGEKVALQINVDRPDAAVLLFVRPANSVYQPPRIIRVAGKSTLVEIDVRQADMPNFFVEAVALHSGRLHNVVREVFVPPVERVINVEAAPNSDAYLPGQQAEIQLKLTDENGEPFVGSTVVAVYDKALDYISGGGNVPEIREFFWKWRRRHHPYNETNLGRMEYPVVGPSDKSMADLGVFGGTVIDELRSETAVNKSLDMRQSGMGRRRMLEMARAPASGAVMESDSFAMADSAVAASGREDGQAVPLVEPTIRQQFADTALWIAALSTNSDGIATFELEMPENLTAWKVNVWGMGHGTRVGHGSAEVVTRKNLIVRLQTPRFLVERDEVVISANVHNYLEEPKAVRVRLEAEGDVLSLLGEGAADSTTDDDPSGSALWSNEVDVEVPAGGEQRVDWRVRVDAEGKAIVRASALTDEESDATQLSFPTYVHGMLKTESFSGVVRAEQSTGGFTFRVPSERRPEQTRLEIRYTPTLAGAMIDALPYLIDYSYGCTEQTLNRFVPAVVTQRTLQQMNLDLAAIRKARANLNAQEIGDDRERAAQWKRYDRDPVFDQAELDQIVKTGVNRLTEMQLSDGGWGWFSGWGERSTPHTTAVVVHGLLVAKDNEVALVPGVVERGVQWLADYQTSQLRALDNWDRDAKKPRNDRRPYKVSADNVDALVFMVLAEAEQGGVAASQADQPDAGSRTAEMRDYLYADRTHLTAYSLAMYGVALHWQEESDKLAMILRNLSQYVEQDDENQTAWLNLGGGAWWYWYGSENEAMACYLKLLVATQPESPVAPRLVKYLLNNRRHDSRWNSTRDTALVIEAFADYIQATGEDQPDLQLEVWIDGQKRKEVRITGENLFSFDNKLVVAGADLEPGDHRVELRRSGSGPIYFNGYLTNFTLEDPIDPTGLEVKVQRCFYRLTPREKAIDVSGERGQPVGQQVKAYDRAEIANFEAIESGDLVEIELVVESKNDYEYILLEDMKAAGFEPVEVRSGYNGNELGAYVEYRDDHVGLFVQRLMRGRHSVSYRLRAETPGRFSALPTRASAMYAPELKANSGEFKAMIIDAVDVAQTAAR